MNKFARDFISEERRNFTFKIGNTIASALSGFIAGAVAAVIVVWVAYNYLLQ